MRPPETRTESSRPIESCLIHFPTDTPLTFLAIGLPGTVSSVRRVGPSPGGAQLTPPGHHHAHQSERRPSPWPTALPWGHSPAAPTVEITVRFLLQETKEEITAQVLAFHGVFLRNGKLGFYC